MSEGVATAHAAGAASPPAPRVVPGAPPPQPLTKSQLRKRKKSSGAKTKLGHEEAGAGLDIVETPREAALVDHVPSVVADTLIATAEETKANHEDVTSAAATEKPASPIIDLVVNKKIKHFSKKLQRIHMYSSNAPDTLNDDQKNAIQTIPQLEAVLRELEEVKKLIEAHESAQAAKVAEERAAEARAAEQHIRETVKFAEAQHVTHTRSLLAFLALSTLLAAPIPVNGASLGDHRLPLDEAEKLAVVDAGKTLLTPEFGGEKEGLLKALLGIQQDGSFAGISYDRLRQIAAQFIHPTTPIPSAPSSPSLAPTTNGAVESSIKFAAPGSSLSREPTPTPPTPPVQAAAGVSLLPMPISGSFQFMSASDLDLDPSNDITEQETPVAPANEWVHVEQIQSAPSFGVSTEDIVQQGAVLSGEAEKLAQEEVQELQVQSHITEVAITETAPPEVAAATLDWATADEDSGLPSIDSLEQQFGKSGAATPNSPFASGAATPAKPPAVSAEPSTNKQTNGIATPVDEWQSTGPRPHGGRGGRGGRYSWGPSVETDTDGFIGTGGRRGGRGARGDYRNGERGRGGFRGGEFGQRGGYRGIERGGYRSGDGRNASRERRGDGNEGPGTPPNSDGFRGRGRGGRGGYRGRNDEDGGRGRGGRGRGPRGRGDDSRGGAPSPAPS